MNSLKERLEKIEVEEKVHIPTLDGQGIAETVHVKVPAWKDPTNGEIYLGEEAQEILDKTKARHMGLLSPLRIRKLREHHFLTQARMAQLFQLGEKTWTRWESGRERPSRSMNILLRAFEDGKISMDYLDSLQRSAGRIFLSSKSGDAEEAPGLRNHPASDRDRRLTRINSFDQLIADAALKGKDFLTDRRVAKYLRPFDEDGMMDPTFLWFLRRLKGSPEIIIILQDWYLEEKTVGTVEQSIDYIDKCYNKVHVKPDSTFLYLFQTYWSRCLIDDGRCFVVNAAWGIRRKKEFTKATGYLGKELHMIAREKLWLWVVEELQPKQVWLAQSWAEEKTEIKAGKDRFPDIKWKLVYHPASAGYWMNQRVTEYLQTS